MARYTITYKCGCTEDMQLFGKMTDRDRKIEYYKTIDCPHCRALAAAEAAKADGLVALTGSDKQIAWATEIRNTARRVADEFMTKINSGHVEAKAAIETIFAQSSASYWINNRYELTSSDVRTFASFLFRIITASNK